MRNTSRRENLVISEGSSTGIADESSGKIPEGIAEKIPTGSSVFSSEDPIGAPIVVFYKFYGNCLTFFWNFPKLPCAILSRVSRWIFA